MKKGKIKEWHLDAELLRKLMSGGNSNIEQALADYVKKTDIIPKEQLSDAFLTEINSAHQAIYTAIEATYRRKNIPITKEDLDAEVLNALETVAQIQESSNFTRNDIVDIANDAVSEALNNSTKFVEIKEEILASVQEILNEMQQHLEEIANRVSGIDTELESFKAEADSKYRVKNEAITANDLDPELQLRLDTADENIQNLQEQINNNTENTEISVSGRSNQVLIINAANDIAASDIVQKIDMVLTESELNTARAALQTPILSFAVPQSIYTINLDDWNKNGIRVKDAENTPEPPPPPPTYYTVSYQFDTILPENMEDKTLPEAIINMLPAAETEHVAGDTVTAPTLAQVSVNTNDGVWNFVGWSPEEVEVVDSNIIITGTWEFSEPEPEPVTYAVHYVYEGEPPENVQKTIPFDETGKTSGMFIFPNDPYYTTVLVDSLLWTFQGWDNPTGVEIKDSDITFTGVWNAVEVDPTDEQYAPYKDLDFSGHVPPVVDDDTNTSSDTGNTPVTPTPTTPDPEPDPEPEIEPEPEPEPYVGLTYTDYHLDPSHYKVSGISIETNDTITGENNSTIDKAYVSFGFYGTRFKLYSYIQDIAQTVKVIVDNNNEYSRTLNAKDEFAEGVTEDPFCCLCVEQLSEGIHLVQIVVEPGAALLLQNKVSIDDNGALLIKADIQDPEFYDQPMFDTGDYTDVLTGTYSFVKSDAIHTVGNDDYVAEAFEVGSSGYERRLLYSTRHEEFFYMDENGVLLQITKNQDAKLAELEARIAALEA